MNCYCLDAEPIALRILYLVTAQDRMTSAQVVLKRHGIEPEVCTITGKDQFKECLRNSAYDAVLSDFELDGWSGLEALDLAVEIQPDIPFIMVTDYHGEDAALDALRRGATDVVYTDRLALLPVTVRRAVQERALLNAHARAEHALRSANRVLTALIRCAPLPITVIDRNGTVNVWNPAAEEVMGWSKDETLGNRLSQVMKDAPDLANLLERALHTGGVLGAETRQKRKDGASVDLRIYGAPLTGGEGEVQGVVGMLTDVTERNLIIEAFRESKERFQSAFVYAPIGMVIISLDDRILRINPAFCRMLGADDASLLRMSYVDLIHPDDRPAVQAASEEGSTQREIRLQYKDGPLLHVQWNTSEVHDSAGKPQYRIVQVVDITESKNADVQIRRYAADLERSNSDLQHFAYVASHDLQEPLRMVRGFVELLAKRCGGKLGEDADEYIRYAVDGAKRMQNLIRGLLAYSRVNTQGKSFEPVNTEEIVDQSMLNLQVALEESQAEVTHDPLPGLAADKVQMAQLFQNLLGNAVKFRSSEPPKIHIAVDDKDDVWQFSVRDNGIGFDSHHANRIFQMFQRLHGPTKYEGTGIGLALCKRIVERHGGRIWVDSAPGEGSSFCFTIPKEAAALS